MNEELRAILERAKLAGENLMNGAVNPNLRLESFVQWAWRVEALIRDAYGVPRARAFREWVDPLPQSHADRPARFLAAQLAKVDTLIASVETAVTRSRDSYIAWATEDFGPETPMVIQRDAREPIDVPRARI